MPNTGGNIKIWIAPVVIRTITIYANYYDDPFNETVTNYGLYYSIGGGSDINLVAGDSIDNACNLMGTVQVPSGNTFYIGFTNVSKLRTPYNFDGSFSTGDIDCPGTLNFTYCGTNNVGGNPLGVNVSTSNINIALTIAVVKGSFSAC